MKKSKLHISRGRKGLIELPLLLPIMLIIMLALVVVFYYTSRILATSISLADKANEIDTILISVLNSQECTQQTGMSMKTALGLALSQPVPKGLGAVHIAGIDNPLWNPGTMDVWYDGKTHKIDLGVMGKCLKDQLYRFKGSWGHFYFDVKYGPADFFVVDKKGFGEKSGFVPFNERAQEIIAIGIGPFGKVAVAKFERGV